MPSPSSTLVEAGPTRLDRRAWAVLLVLCGALFLDALDVSMVGVALPSIRSDLGMSTSSLQWVVSAYVLGYGGFLLLGGRAADLLGRRRMFLISLGVFVVASAARRLRGRRLAAHRHALHQGRERGVHRARRALDHHHQLRRGRRCATRRSRSTPRPARRASRSGLVIGGLLTEVGWRWVFLLPVPVAVAVLIAAIRLVPDSAPPERGRRSFDLAGAVSITAGMLLLVYTRRRGAGRRAGRRRARSSRSPARRRCFAVFAAVERRSPFPLVRLGILRSAPLVRANLGAMALFGGVGRLPVHRDALHAAAARLVAARDRARDLPRRAAGGAHLAAHRGPRRALRRRRG